MVNIKDVNLFKSQKITIATITIANMIFFLISKNYMFSQNPGYVLGFVLVYGLFTYGLLYAIFLLVNILVYKIKDNKILRSIRK